jgi:hypothetical protein
MPSRKFRHGWWIFPLALLGSVLWIALIVEVWQRLA